MNCKQCNKIFTKVTKNQKYCSRRCRDKRYKQSEKGKIVDQRYNKSSKGKKTRARYAKTNALF